MTNLTRRDALFAAAGVAVITMTPIRAFAAESAAMEAAKGLGLDGAKASDMITLDMPEIAENGNTVPLSVSVKSPMSADDYVKRIVVLADGNPSPGVAIFNFSPASGVASAGTRMRMAKTQDIYAIAETSKGEMYMASVNVKVTIGGCGG